MFRRIDGIRYSSGYVFSLSANYEKIPDAANSELSMVTRGYGGL